MAAGGGITPRGRDDAVRLVLADQEAAGLDIVTDGEQRRRHCIWGFLDGLTGIDTERLDTRLARGGRYTQQTAVARIVSEVAWSGPVFVEAVRSTRAHTDRQNKVTLPGPMTVMDSLLDEHYRTDEQTLVMRFAALLNEEARALAETGTDVVQFDEPCFNIYLDKFEAWGIEAPEVVAARIRRVLPYVPLERLLPCIDCGIVPRSRRAARGKLQSHAAGPQSFGLSCRPARQGSQRQAGRDGRQIREPAPDRCGRSSSASSDSNGPAMAHQDPGRSLRCTDPAVRRAPASTRSSAHQMLHPPS